MYLLFQAKSVEEKRLWAQHIKRLILENHNTIVPQKVNSIILHFSLLSLSRILLQHNVFLFFEGKRGHPGQF